MREQTTTYLHPGYREDLLVVFPTPGFYCILDDELAARPAVDIPARGPQLLGYVQVDAGREIRPDRLADHVKSELLEAARQHMPDRVRP